MKTFPIHAIDEEIKVAVVEWSELLAQKRFAEALAMFSPAQGEQEITAEWLANWISNYGFDEPYSDGRKYEITSLMDLSTKEEIISNTIDVDRENLYGLPPDEYVGMVHYDDVPLNGEPSDLTARFHIKKTRDDLITLEFLDIHVM